MFPAGRKTGSSIVVTHRSEILLLLSLLRIPLSVPEESTKWAKQGQSKEAENHRAGKHLKSTSVHLLAFTLYLKKSRTREAILCQILQKYGGQRISTPHPLYNHCIASTIELALDGASTHHPSFLSLPWASSQRASHIHLCPTFGESPSFLSGGRKMRLRLAAHRVQLLEKLKKPRPRCQGSPGLEESEASPDTTRRLRLPQDPNSSPPRFLRPCTKASQRSSWTGAIMLRRGVGKPTGCGISSAEKPPPFPRLQASSHNTYPTAWRHLHCEVNGKPENAVKSGLEP